MGNAGSDKAFWDHGDAMLAGCFATKMGFCQRSAELIDIEPKNIDIQTIKLS
jgi:hypothetical protein